MKLLFYYEKNDFLETFTTRGVFRGGNLKTTLEHLCQANLFSYLEYRRLTAHILNMKRLTPLYINKEIILIFFNLAGLKYIINFRSVIGYCDSNNEVIFMFINGSKLSIKVQTFLVEKKLQQVRRIISYKEEKVLRQFLD